MGPNSGWILMYRDGFSLEQIAEMSGVATSAVEEFLTAAEIVHPDHHANAPRAVKQSMHPGLPNMYRVLAMVDETGRYPSMKAEDEAERKLADWLRRRRRDAEAGILADVIREGLSALPDWQRPARVLKAELQWQEKLQALVSYRAEGRDWPRVRYTDNETERELGVWLSWQRYKLRQGKLSSTNAETMDKTLPGWTTGRKPGRSLPGKSS